MSSTDVTTLDPGQLGADAFCDALFAYLTEAGASRYDEVVTQLEHALQSAWLAEQEGFDEAAQVAALLHDLGHLILDEFNSNGEFLHTDLRHEVVGARVVTGWFGQAVGAPVAMHVAAKRYLVAVEPAYADGLSPASTRSLALQGGPMSAAEVTRFESAPHHRVAVALRRWDDAAKVPGLPTPDLEHWRPAIRSLLAA